MYAGSPTVQVVSFDVAGGDFTVLPSNARLQTGTPPPGTPELLRLDLAVPQRADRLQVPRRLEQHLALDLHRSRHSHRRHQLAERGRAERARRWAATASTCSRSGRWCRTSTRNIGGVESLWATHTVRRGNTTGFAAPRWYQVNVTGGTVAADHPAGRDLGPGRRERHPPLHAEPRGRPRRRHGARLQHVEQHDQARRSSTPAGWRPIPSTRSARPSSSSSRAPARRPATAAAPAPAGATTAP